MQHLNEEFQAEIVQKDVADGHKEIPDNLRPTLQSRARETDVTRHPEARKEGDGEFEHESGDVGREGQKGDVSIENKLTEIEHLCMEDEMVEHIVQYPLQNEVQATTSRITEQLEAHYLTERRIEEVDDLGQGAFYPGFYVAEG